ncbi:hypothetical protein VTH82DRAFT_184 [Thermothelomyces myriococcoides]
MTATESGKRTSGNEDKAPSKSESESKTNEQHASTADNANRAPKKRRKLVFTVVDL